MPEPSPARDHPLYASTRPQEIRIPATASNLQGVDSKLCTLHLTKPAVEHRPTFLSLVF